MASMAIPWIWSFLQGRKQHVLVEGEKSEEADVTSGVPQGTVMGPLLFLAFINDLPSVVKSQTRLFTDDCLLFRPIHNQQDADALQEDLDALAKWEADWQMAIHPQKCISIQVTRSKKSLNNSYQLHGHALEKVRSSRYLGVTISEDLNWSEHIRQTTAKAWEPDMPSELLLEGPRVCQGHAHQITVGPPSTQASQEKTNDAV